jgi:hypothetical protein
VTVRASGTPHAAALAAAPAAEQAQAPHPSSGVVVGGSPSGDVIVMSQRALTLIQAGQRVRAFVIAGLETIRRSIALGANRTLVLEHGIYQLV